MKKQKNLKFGFFLIDITRNPGDFGLSFKDNGPIPWVCKINGLFKLI